MKRFITLAGSIVCMGLFAEAITLTERYNNEWTFETDPAGTSLSAALNSGTDTPKAQFAAGFAQTVFTTNHPTAGNVLLCVGEDETGDQSGTWTSGAILDAVIDPDTGPVHYLRYDIEYDFHSGQNSSVAGIYFVNDLTGRMGGAVLGSFTDNALLNDAPSEVKVIPRSVLGDEGRITVIAEINYTWAPFAQLLVWYSVNNPVDLDISDYEFVGFWSDPARLNGLRFHATGDIRPDGTDDYIAVQTIRHAVGTVSGGAAWDAIREPLIDLTATPALEIDVDDTMSGAMVQGETNLVSVVVTNPSVGLRIHPATDVISQLTHDGAPTDFTVVGAHPPVAMLRGGESITNVYEVIAHEPGTFTFEALGVSAQTNSAPATFDLDVLGTLEVLPVTDADIVEVAGGSYPGFYEPGETLHITLTTTNQGVAAVSHTLNQLVAPAGFTVTALDSQVYGTLNPGDIATTTYEVIIGAGTDFGVYTFDVVNEGNGQTWTASFDLEVSTRFPKTDWVKADNNEPLNDPDSWVRGQVPNETDRALMDATVTSAITTPLGENLSWRGIALVSNTVDWTISGPDILTIGSAGIDMAEAQGDLQLDSRLHLASTQTWDVAENRTLDVTGIVTGMNTEPLVKKGEGTVRMTNPANTTLRGGMRVEEGTLTLAGNNVLGRGDLTIGDAILSTSAAASLTNRVHLTGGAELANADALTLRGVIGGSGSLAKSGNGDLILGRANLYTGGTTISGGRVELQNNRALGTGPVTMHTGSSLYSGVDVAGVSALSLSAPLTNPIEVLGNVTFETLPLQDNSGLMVVDGDISGDGKIMIDGFEFYLRGDNRDFTGGIDLHHNNWLRVTRHALGTGPLTTLRNVNVLALEPMEISNPIVINDNFRFHNAGDDVLLSGPMSGGGQLLLIDSNVGVVTITGDNSARSGNTIVRRPLIRLGHPNALGDGNVLLEPQHHTFEINVLQDQTGPDAMGNAWIINRSFSVADTGERHPVRFNLDHDLELTGSITQRDEVAALPFEKEGPGALILSGPVNIPGALNVVGGSLVVNSTVQNERISMAGGTVLSGTGTVGNVLLRAGSTLNLPGSMTFQQPPEIQPGAEIVLDVVDTTAHGAIVGTGTHALELTGTLVLDFAGSPPGAVNAGDEFHILRDWALLMDDGVEVIARNLPADLALNTSQLFTQGRVVLDAQVAPVPPPVEPGEIVKDANNDALNLASSWVGGIVPGAQNHARFDSRVWVPLTTPLGADTSWRGISLVSNVVDWTISGTQTLTIGSGGIDMRRARADLRIGSRLVAGTSQRWDVASGRTLSMNNRVTSGEGTVIVKSGEGRLRFPAGVERRLSGELVVSNGTLAVSGGFVQRDDIRVETGAPPIGRGRLRLLGGTTLATVGAAGGLANPITIEKKVETGAGGEVIEERFLRATPGQSLLLAGPVSGSGGLIHNGTGILRLAGTNSFSGGTTVDSGSTLEFTQFRALGTGPVTLRDGSALHGWLPAEENLPADRTVINRIFLEGGQAVIENFADANNQDITFAGPISGPGGLRVNLSVGRRDINLSARNTFEGNLEIFNQGGNVTLHGAGPESLGRGNIVALGTAAFLGFNETGGRILNRIDLTSGSLVFVNQPDTEVEFAGEIFGSGSISLVNRRGTIRLSGDNRDWSGGIDGIGSFNQRYGLKRLIVDHPFALGTGEIILGSHTHRENYVEVYIRASVTTSNDLYVADSGPEKTRNDLFMIGQNSIFGKLDGEGAHQGLDKIGAGRMTLTAQGNYPSPFNLRDGSLKLDSAGFPGRTTVFSGTKLVASSARTGAVRVRSGGTIEVKGDGLRVEGGNLIVEGDSRTILRLPDNFDPAVRGDQANELSLSGTVLLDLSAYAGVASETTVTVFDEWDTIVDQGVKIAVAGLDGFRTVDHSNLFVDGTVEIVDGGRYSSQRITINVTAGSTKSASIQAHNPGTSPRYFKLMPGANWAAWLTHSPTRQTEVNAGAQKTITVTADARNLTPGAHSFLLPVHWTDGTQDVLVVSVNVSGPSLQIQDLTPLNYSFDVVEGQEKEEPVFRLHNDSDVQVSYQVRPVVDEFSFYTQTEHALGQMELSANRIDWFDSSGRSLSRSIAPFPFFGQMYDEIRVGNDGSLWLGDQRAIRVFSGVTYNSDISKSGITTRSVDGRTIVTWTRMVQSGDGALQTFQAVLHPSGRIDMNYEEIRGAWQDAQIGLHGPRQWHPAQRPEVLEGKTLRFEPDAQSQRIRVLEHTGTLKPDETRDLLVRGNAEGLNVGDVRTAVFAFDYEGIPGPAKERVVTMNVVAAPAPDPVGDELMDVLAPSPMHPYGPEPKPVLILNPPQRTGEGRKITWSVDDGGMQPFGTPVYRIDSTTNLGSGDWTERARVTGEKTYTDPKAMDGRVIFYRVVKEKE